MLFYELNYKEHETPEETLLCMLISLIALDMFMALDQEHTHAQND